MIPVHVGGVLYSFINVVRGRLCIKKNLFAQVTVMKCGDVMMMSPAGILPEAAGCLMFFFNYIQVEQVDLSGPGLPEACCACRRRRVWIF